MEEISGRIKKIIFRNRQTGYSILKLDDGVTIIGVLPEIFEGQKIKAAGRWIEHIKYGKQFGIDRFEIEAPDTEDTIKQFLTSGFFQGISSKTVEAIFRKFGERVNEIFANNIERLKEVPGIGRRKFEMIKEKWEEQHKYLDLLNLLKSSNLPDHVIMRIFNAYGESAVELISKDPYLLAGRIWGIDFKAADRIAVELGFPSINESRFKAGILSILEESARSGNVYLPYSNLAGECEYLLGYQLAINDPILAQMEVEETIVINEGRIYLTELYIAEDYVSQTIAGMIESVADSRKLSIDREFVESYGYSEEQLLAIEESIKNKILIITGGPGTGKTTTLKGIIDSFNRFNKEVMIAAPTGRGAKRIQELVGFEAKTIHRLLEYNPIGDYFNYNETNKLPVDLLILDEVSMVDTLLMYYLMSAVDTDRTKIVLIGDADQLPSVGPGNILKDLLESERVPVVKLSRIFRQSEKSSIITTAHSIINGLIPDFNRNNDSDILFIEETESSKIPDLIVELVTRKIPEQLGYDPLRDIQIITPMYKGSAGADNLNSIFQRKINNEEFLIPGGIRRFKPGDKVMQQKNDYQKNIFNGDIGFIHGYNSKNDSIRVDFNGQFVDYSESELDQLVLAYAISVHKSQGSEFPCVILPVTRSHFIMLQRNLLYTAVTRASDLLVLIGSRSAVEIAVKNNKTRNRFSSLLK